MARPATKAIKLKDGFYIEVRNKGAQSGIKIRRNSKEMMQMAVKQYEKTKVVLQLGEMKNGAWVDGK